MWLLAALPGNLTDLLGGALNLPPPVSAPTPADEADNGVPGEQLLPRTKIPEVEIRRFAPPAATVCVVTASEFKSPPLRAPHWQFLQRAAAAARAPDFFA